MGGYRGPLWQQTAGLGWTWQYVGSVVYGPPGIGGCEGHTGWTIDQITGLIPTALPSYLPNVLLLQIGTNDFIKLNETPQMAITKMGALLDAITAVSPHTQVFVASPTPVGNSSEASIAAFAQLLPALVQSRASAGAPFTFVDMHSLCGFVPADLGPDMVHPMASGYAKMASVWYNVLQGAGIPH